MLIAVDHGNKQIKTVHTPPFTSGLIQSDTPGFGTDALAYFHAFSLLYIRAKEAFAKTSATISSSAGAAETTESSFAEHSACA